MLAFAPDGFVRVYPDLWRREAEFSAPDDQAPQPD
jgi:hypothetical protein